MAGPRIALAQIDSSITVLRFPYLQRMGSYRAAILWATLERGVGRIQYSADTTFSNIVTAHSRTCSSRRSLQHAALWLFPKFFFGACAREDAGHSVIAFMAGVLVQRTCNFLHWNLAGPGF